MHVRPHGVHSLKQTPSIHLLAQSLNFIYRASTTIALQYGELKSLAVQVRKGVSRHFSYGACLDTFSPEIERDVKTG